MANISKIKVANQVYDIRDDSKYTKPATGIPASDIEPGVIPVVNDGQLTMQVNGTQKAAFTANQSGNVTFNVTAEDLGLSQALIFKGITITDLKDGDTTSPITMDGGESLTPSIGNVVITKSTVATWPNTEFVWASGKWNKLGDAKSYALKTIKVEGNGALSGGGDLSADRVITHNAGNAASQESGLYKFSTDAYSHINSVAAVAKSDITALGVEDAANKVTSIGASSTDTEYASAKAVYSAIQEAGVLPSQSGQAGKYLRTDGTAPLWSELLASNAAYAILEVTTATSYTLTHNLGTRKVFVEIYDNTTYETILADVVRDSDNTVVVSFSEPPAHNCMVMFSSVSPQSIPSGEEVAY